MTSTAIQAVIDIEIYLLIFCVLLFPNPEKTARILLQKRLNVLCLMIFPEFYQ